MVGQMSNIMKVIINRSGVIILVLVVFAAGFFSSNLISPHQSSSYVSPVVGDTPSKPDTFWTCSMHPQIRQEEPGKCPLCAMDLIPVTDSDNDSASERHFSTSEATKALMKIQTSPVERRVVAKEVRMVGKVVYDETKLGYITSWVAGRLDKLYVDYTGVHVNKGDHLVYMYSPELITAREELKRAVKTVKGLRDDSPNVIRTTSTATLEAVRRKLQLWGLKDAQIREAERSGILSDHITIYAPMGGTVVHMNAQQGMYVNVGTRIYTIADLNYLWVKLDAYESDLPWIHYGQKVEFTSEAYPGQVFEGTVAFIDPLLDEKTRTIKVRVNVTNKDSKLKPGMFVRGIVRADVASGGKVIAPELEGKHICPMHPEIVKDEPAACDLCGMDLVTAESLGYKSVADDVAPLIIPATAPLLTGKRAVVYVEVPNADRPTYEGREIVLGPRAGDYYIVEDGLTEGERVVTNGSFKIDSALQILARPSMMSLAEVTDVSETESEKSSVQKTFSAPSGFKSQLRSVVESYFAVQTKLAEDDLKGTAEAVKKLSTAVSSIDKSLLKGESEKSWSKYNDELNKSLEGMKKSKEIQYIRKSFDIFSQNLTASIKTFGVAPGSMIFEVNCPMAFDFRGANWLQNHEKIRNPYFGSQMLECGTVLGSIGGGTDSSSGHETHNHVHGPQCKGVHQ